MTSKTIRRPAALTALLKAAKTKPVSLPAGLFDTASVLRRESLGEMPIGEVLALTGYYRENGQQFHRLQRDTEARLAGQGRRSAHLRNYDFVPAPQHVISLVYFNDKVEVLDGNTRLMLWSGVTSQTSLVPASVLVTMYYPADQAEYDQLYRCFDSNEAKKSNQDNLFGILRAEGLKPTSELLLRNKVVSAIRDVAGVLNTPEGLLEGVRALKRPLAYLDSYGFSSKRSPENFMCSGVYAGLLALLFTGEDKKTVAAFAKELKSSSESASYVSGSAAVCTLVDELKKFPARGAQVNLRKVRKMVESAYREFTTAHVATKAPRRTVRAKGVLKAA